MANLEDRRVSFASKSGEEKRGPSPAPSSRGGSMSGPGGKDKKGKNRRGSQSPKGSRSPKGSFGRRGSRRGSKASKKDAATAQDTGSNNRGRSDSLFKKSDVRYKEIRRALTKRQRDLKKASESGEKPTQEL